MYRLLFTIFLIFLACSCATQKKVIFIPQSPLTLEELEEQKAKIRDRNNWTEEEIERFIGDGSTMYTYRESDVRAAFSEVEEKDKQFSLCSNSIMSGATQVIFLTPPSENTVTVKYSLCGIDEGGLSCDPVEKKRQYYYLIPENFFSLEDGVTYEEAALLLSTYKQFGVVDLPKLYRGFKYSSVKSIGKSPEGYLVSLGEFYCGGCTANFVLRIENTGRDNHRLVLAKEPEGRCI